MDGISCEFVLFVSPLLILLASFFFHQILFFFTFPHKLPLKHLLLSTKPISSEIAHQLLCSLFSSLFSSEASDLHIKYMCRNTPHLVRRRTFLPRNM
ncbi:uncharacterized protein BO88DRAFT_18642 [Aspergillus vadensis CBS 113365]|uniref:Uncharacterized protein n=1 Tax=Aspergillus vadensis (strain CBS 113365 / IMI 142717 / IBT 24658) TaxID=1448311 RepID=A0A319BTP6_ASPVC|nr:hypothetical protein BO88DRAFT_18642 [Aspergillus vadensis CBS 113365]PYH74650.1 hypothetical protein BO88DRAFT_18642 [Aspergillus vadensis CBS 113365]